MDTSNHGRSKNEIGDLDSNLELRSRGPEDVWTDVPPSQFPSISTTVEASTSTQKPNYVTIQVQETVGELGSSLDGMGTPRHRRVRNNDGQDSRGSNGNELLSSLGFDSLDGLAYISPNANNTNTNADGSNPYNTDTPYSPTSDVHFPHPRPRSSSRPHYSSFISSSASGSDHDSASVRSSLSSSSTKTRILSRLSLGTYTPTLHRWAARANLKALKEITLAHVLSGDTCDPIGLSEFEAFLTFRDYSLENLQFVVWFQDYRDRFDKLPEEVKRLSPSPLTGSSSAPPSSPSVPPTTTFMGDNVDVELGDVNREREKVRNARSRVRLLGSIKRYANNMTVPRIKLPPTPSNAKTAATTAMTGDGLDSGVAMEESVFGGMQKRAMESMAWEPAVSDYPPLSPLSSSSSTAPLNGLRQNENVSRDAPGNAAANSSSSNRDGISNFAAAVDQDMQPFREECMHVLATFVSPRAKRELLLNSKTKDDMIKSLVRTTHPDVFLRAYESTYELVETVSLPRFLAFSTININSPKQLYWYSLGALFTIISIAVALGIVIGVPVSMDDTSAREQGKRAWRLFAVLPGFLGITFMYSAWRGFCSRLFERKTTQLRVWEMDGLDEDTVKFYSGFLPAPPTFPFEEEDGEHRNIGKEVEGERNSKVLIAPFDVPEDDSEEEERKVEEVVGGATTSRGEKSDFDSRNRRSGSGAQQASGHGSKRKSDKSAIKTTAKSKTTETPYKRPPIFGPEKVVRDARILEVHRRVLIDIWKVGLIYVAIASAILFSVPSFRH